MSRTRALFASGSSVFHRASRWLHPACVLCVVAGLSFGAPVPAQSPSSAKIVVRVDSVGVTHVEQRYRLANDSGPARFRVLQRPCSRIGPVNVTVADAPRTLAPLPHGPWLEYVDSSDAARTAEREVSLAYDVNLTGREGEAEGDIPLVHLAAVGQGRSGPRRGGGSHGAVREWRRTSRFPAHGSHRGKRVERALCRRAGVRSCERASRIRCALRSPGPRT